MKPIKDILIQSRLAWWCIQQVQQDKGIAATQRINLDSDNHKQFLPLMPMVIAIYNFGENTAKNMEVEFNWQEEKAYVQIDDITSLIRPDRLTDFDPMDLDTSYGEILVNVALADALERLPIWESLPRNPKEFVLNEPPKVVGGI